MKRIYFTVTNDLSYDQRMQRICGSLARNGFDVVLVGRKLPGSIPLVEQPFKQKRIRCWFKKTKWFYAEYNFRLFFYLLFKKMDGICAIDLDTILPCLYISKIRKVTRVYDAHELFTELKEVLTRPSVHKTWLKIEKKAVPQFKWGYTVSEGIAEEFKHRYGVNYEVIRNTPVLEPLPDHLPNKDRLIIYQGAVNEGRGLEWLIPAMAKVDSKLLICGDGNFMPALKKLIGDHQLEHKIELTGMLPPAELKSMARKAYIAVAVPEREGLNQYLALPNKWFDYIHTALPQVTVDYPEYRRCNELFEVAVLIHEATPKVEGIAAALNNLLSNDVLYERLKVNCLAAREVLNWQAEEKKLISFYNSIFNH